MQPHRRQPTRLPRPWNSPGKNTGVGCHFLLQCMKVKSEVESLSRVRLSATPWTAAYQAPPSMGFSSQEYWSGVPLPSPSPPSSYWIFLLPQKKTPKPFKHSLPVSPSPQLLVVTNMLSVSINLPFIIISYKWIIQYVSFLCLASFILAYFHGSCIL